MTLQNLELVVTSQQLEYDDCGKGYGLTGLLPSFFNSPNLCRLGPVSNLLTETINEDFLEDRDHKHLTFFKITCSLAIAPGANTTQNP